MVKDGTDIYPSKPNKSSNYHHLNDGASRRVSKRTVQSSLPRKGLGCLRSMRVPLLNAQRTDTSVWRTGNAENDESQFCLLNAKGG
ncbi:hypothetical protein TNCV_1020671 [Trichonephila clavipes]|uniref:Uncharacterized protein n=1 Tax=Trichonephila clavipes TaxID=2585209 RepID=A0A8X6VDE7_TRICX|nr:hypothetical protein TNCV_1020671 [Trichonephila clavipes]